LKVGSVVLVLALAAGIAFGAVALGRRSNGVASSVGSIPVQLPARAASATAVANVQAALPALQAYLVDHGTYVGATADALRRYDAGVDGGIVVRAASGIGYCVEDTVNGATASATNGGGVVAVACAR